MEIVYASLHRRPAAEPAAVGEVAEIIDAVWAHSIAEDNLEHVSGQAGCDRIDLILFLRGVDGPDVENAQRRVRALLQRSRLASSVLRDRYLAPHPPAGLDEASLNA
ncbi:hypothetical protein [Kitasatospora sp. NPDC005856]|uniref:hypothetical protein n=1 Tax=Kitasatospora sp. NPDC005856 TaxID=3154566 RepID=UPI0033CA389A